MLTLKEETMLRIRFIYLARAAAGSVLVKLAIIAGLLGLVSWWVSIKSVFHNAPNLSNLAGFWGYGANAFLHTELAVKITLIALFCLAWLLVRDILRNNWRFSDKTGMIKY